MRNSAEKIVSGPNGSEQSFGIVDAGAFTTRVIKAFWAWLLAPPNLPTYPSIDYSHETEAEREERLRRIQAQVDDILAPPSADDIAARYRFW